MVDAAKIKKIIGEVPAGRTIAVTEYQDLVESNYPLDEEDRAPYTKTRVTKYPHWKHVLQSVLHEYKEKGLLIHDEARQSYTVVG